MIHDASPRTELTTTRGAGRADPNNPDPKPGDPVLIPSRPLTLACDRQPLTLTFPLLLPEGR